MRVGLNLPSKPSEIQAKPAKLANLACWLKQANISRRDATTKGKSLGDSLLQSRDDCTLYMIHSDGKILTAYYPQTDRVSQRVRVRNLEIGIWNMEIGKRDVEVGK
jgi:hypothetical protein